MTGIHHIGIQNGFDGEHFDLWNIIAPGWAAHGSTIMTPQGTPEPEVTARVMARVAAGGKKD